MYYDHQSWHPDLILYVIHVRDDWVFLFVFSSLDATIMRHVTNVCYQ
jgi:hypothetical protein